MPIVKLSASQAIASVKSNPHSRWPKRSDLNRLSPMAKPGFKAHFTLPRGGTIFTIGSCFARNVERALGASGFHLPALKVLGEDREFAAVGSRVLNNYGAPSICNELKWAFEDETDEAACFYRMGNGWVDLHLQNTLRPAPLNVVRTRRHALRAAYRSIEHCDAVIITLGLSEVWFDTKTGYYLNMAPRRTMLRDCPERFELHVLGYGETISCLREACDLIRAKGRDGIQIVMTVSPVPIQATYRDGDVMVANTYSKAVLRAAAEEITQTYDFVHYFPSFESITLSDRSVAYTDDEVHVTQEIVDLNISRMVQAYTGAPEKLTIDDVRRELATYRTRARLGYEVLAQNLEYCEDPEIAATLVDCATQVGRYDVAEIALQLADDPSGMRRAQLYMAQNMPDRAVAAIKSRPEDPRLLARYFNLRIRVALMAGEYETAESVALDWARTTPNSPLPFKLMATLLAPQDDPRAKGWYGRAVDVSGGETALTLEMADFLIKRGDYDEAQTRLEGIAPASAQDIGHKARLLRAISSNRAPVAVAHGPAF